MKKIFKQLSLLTLITTPASLISCGSKTISNESESWETLEAVRLFEDKSIDYDLSSIKNSSDFDGEIKDLIIAAIWKDDIKKYDGVIFEYKLNSVNNQDLTLTITAKKGLYNSSRKIIVSGKSS